jgi:hypothetical protein
MNLMLSCQKYILLVGRSLDLLMLLRSVHRDDDDGDDGDVCMLKLV